MSRRQAPTKGRMTTPQRALGTMAAAVSTTFVAIGLVLCGIGSNTFGPARAQSYPEKTVKLVVPFTPGSPVDALARVVAQHLTPRLGQSIVIDNRPGAGTTIGTKAVATADPDGYTLLLASTSYTQAPPLYPNLGYDPIGSFAPVAMLVIWDHVLIVEPSVPAKTLQELVAHAKANPGKLTFGFGLGTTPQILGETLKAITGANIVSVPYRGGAQAVTDMLGGRIHMNFGSTATLVPLIQQGKVRALAYSGVTRHRDLPDVPTTTESGFPQVGFKPDAWTGILAPAGTPVAVIDKLNAAVDDMLKSPEMRASVLKLGWEPKSASPQEFAAFLAVELQKWPPIVKAAGLKPE